MQEPMSDQPALDITAGVQKTRKGHEIPVPRRRDLMDAFRKIVQPIKKA